MVTPIVKFSDVKRLGCLASAITFASYHQGVVAFFPHVSYFISMPVKYMEGVVHIFIQFFPSVVVCIYFGVILINVEIIILYKKSKLIMLNIKLKKYLKDSAIN